VAGVVTVMFVVTASLQVSETLFINIALFMALYTVGAWEPSRSRAFWARSLVIAVMSVWLLISIFQSVTDPDAIPGLSRAGAFSPMAAYLMSQVLTNILYFAGAWYFGDHAWGSARERARTEWRGAQLVAERRVVEEQAVSLERLRLARELHDAVAHHVSLMGVQAGAARVLLAADPARAAEALEQVEDSARDAIRQGVLGTLREAGAPARADAVASLSVEQLPALVAQSCDAGVRATFQVIGDSRPLPPLVSLNLYRIAQEALTNTRKHAGEGARADVRLRYAEDAVELEVSDDGGGVTRRARASGSGLGQVGMRERAAADGGSLEAGPRGRGGYLVRARVPLATMRERDDR
jgi:signal transduction histidine kinase